MIFRNIAPSSPLAELLSSLIDIYCYVVMARIVADVAPGLRSLLGTFHLTLLRVTEPLVGRARRWLPPVGLFDVAGVGALLFLWILAEVVRLVDLVLRGGLTL